MDFRFRGRYAANRFQVPPQIRRSIPAQRVHELPVHPVHGRIERSFELRALLSWVNPARPAVAARIGPPLQ